MLLSLNLSKMGSSENFSMSPMYITAMPLDPKGVAFIFLTVVTRITPAMFDPSLRECLHLWCDFIKSFLRQKTAYEWQVQCYFDACALSHVAELWITYPPFPLGVHPRFSDANSKHPYSNKKHIGPFMPDVSTVLLYFAALKGEKQRA